MGIVKAAKLVYEYIRRDEEENIEEVNRAIDGVDVDIKKGDFVAVLGHNGSGKSTLAKHVNGLLLPTEGTVWVGDTRNTSGMCAKQREWCSRIRITRSSAILWRRMWALDRRI